MPHELKVQVSTTVWDALHERARMSGQSVDAIVEAALAEELDIAHDAIFQVSTSGAIVKGVFEGYVSVADLRRHGDVGLGTFDELDGEMIIIDGHCYQAGTNGVVVEAPDTALTPFASVVNFAADRSAELGSIESFDELTAALDQLRISDNGIVAIRAHGRFPHLQLRAACKTEPGVDLVTATANQSLFAFDGIEGDIVGFWGPEYSKSISIAGYHLHFISDDRTKGGHVLDLAVGSLAVEVNDVNDVTVIVPENKAFLDADLTGDPTKDLEKVEREVRGE